MKFVALHRWALGFCSLGVVACRCGTPVAKPPTTPPVQGAPDTSFAIRGALRTLSFEGACDASGAVALSDRMLAVVDDEDNVLRSFDAYDGGAARAAEDLSPSLGLTPKGKRGAWPELDLEAGTRIGDRAYWITSHGRNSKGQLRPERLRFFATTLGGGDAPVQVWGQVYEQLLQDLLAEPKLARFDLGRAAELPPKTAGALNIEGLSAMPDGQLMIGFRNPNPDQHALLVPLRNPDRVVQGERAQFGEPILLDLQGRGVRAMVPFQGRYLIVAGHFAHEVSSQLYVWDGASPPRLQQDIEFGDFNPEAVFAPRRGDEVLILSDDGDLPIDGKPCKKLADPAAKRFRGAWVRVR